MPDVNFLAPRWSASLLARAHEDVAVALAGLPARNDAVVRRAVVADAMDPIVRELVRDAIRTRHRRSALGCWQEWSRCYVDGVARPQLPPAKRELGVVLVALTARWSDVATTLAAPLASTARR